jgi:hypothetical protein
LAVGWGGEAIARTNGVEAIGILEVRQHKSLQDRLRYHASLFAIALRKLFSSL